MDLKKKIAKNIRIFNSVADEQIKILDEKKAALIAEETGTSLNDIYIAALEQEIIPERYLKNRQSISSREQISLARSSVAVVGAGGLGGHVLLQLTRIGIGCLKIIDYDIFDETNLNRQFLLKMESLGKKKAIIAENEIKAINPAIKTEIFPEKLTSENAETMCEGSDVIIDALDNMADRLILEEAAGKLDIPMIHGAIAGFEGRIMTIFPGDSRLKILFGDIQDHNNDTNVVQPAEALLGTPTMAPAVIGSFQAMEAVKIILKKGKLFRNRMAHFDLLSGQMEVFEM